MILYRAVSEAEHNDLINHQEFRTAQNTLEGKQYFKSRTAVNAFVRISKQRRYSPPYRYRVKVNIEDNLLNGLVHDEMILDGFEAISIDEQHLTNFNNSSNFEIDGQY